MRFTKFCRNFHFFFFYNFCLLNPYYQIFRIYNKITFSNSSKGLSKHHDWASLHPSVVRSFITINQCIALQQSAPFLALVGQQLIVTLYFSEIFQTICANISIMLLAVPEADLSQNEVMRRSAGQFHLCAAPRCNRGSGVLQEIEEHHFCRMLWVDVLVNLIWFRYKKLDGVAPLIADPPRLKLHL